MGQGVGQGVGAAAGVDGVDGSNCWDDLATDHDGDGEMTSADCLWAVICPGPAAEMDDANGDGVADIL